jgi:hypothetical protein
MKNKKVLIIEPKWNIVKAGLGLTIHENLKLINFPLVTVTTHNYGNPLVRIPYATHDEWALSWFKYVFIENLNCKYLL